MAKHDAEWVVHVVHMAYGTRVGSLLLRGQDLDGQGVGGEGVGGGGVGVREGVGMTHMQCKCEPFKWV
jgi:hypothetical protein